MFKLLVLTSFVVSLCCFMIGTALMFAIPSVAASGPWAGGFNLCRRSRSVCVQCRLLCECRSWRRHRGDGPRVTLDAGR